MWLSHSTTVKKVMRRPPRRLRGTNSLTGFPSKLFSDASIILIGEIGGTAEEDAAAVIKESGTQKPIVAFTAGLTASLASWVMLESLDEDSWKFVRPRSKIHLVSRPGLAQISTCMLIASQYFVNVDDTVAQKIVVHKSSRRGTHFRRARPRQKLRSISLSLDALLDYNDKDIEESTFEVSQKGKIGITLISHWMVAFSASKVNDDAAQRAIDVMLGW
ncbi:uncharacterized protein LOC131243159 isoform X2 [Magnolia sinica]|uniref:uncharacterized protein LOC131243159 isoform X2 n=1 Tax=Magnolia sinica TaxID=86752 RepID=UPI002658E2BF|nr:uncharacterized protein LOC131243159 isoform X2 [Magnolia sinica]